MAFVAAASTASVTAATSPCTIMVTSRPPSLRSHDASSTSAVLHMMSRALIAATTPVISINPYDKDCEFKNLSNIPKKITAIDFCVNVTKGLDILKQYKNENIKYLLAQPGARSLELEQYCIENNILYLEDCALVQLKNL